eukprot:CAMPEP_0172498798 /NCGR_PEP_ID=MMETSP1066-20121228/117561_1 /TAXON_ID=671091 /ORGANISM="Coscinodiscus wailesii, Strain CCMP2513" /LENGTH=538 /DNA_ID=CAMNT_0013272227 /DNA_START=66 /DNA_END=1682 /DNA_ORIENTATION=+
MASIQAMDGNNGDGYNAKSPSTQSDALQNTGSSIDVFAENVAPCHEEIDSQITNKLAVSRTKQKKTSPFLVDNPVSVISDLQRSFISKMKKTRKLPKRCRKLITRGKGLKRSDSRKSMGSELENTDVPPTIIYAASDTSMTTTSSIHTTSFDNTRVEDDCDDSLGVKGVDDLTNTLVNSAFSSPPSKVSITSTKLHEDTPSQLDIPKNNQKKSVAPFKSPTRSLFATDKVEGPIETQELKAPEYRIYVLLIDASTRQFELILLEFSSPTTTIGDLIAMIPLNSKNLGDLTYRGLCRPKEDSVEMTDFSANVTSRDLNGCRIISGEILLGIPDGNSGRDVQAIFCKKLKKHPKLNRILQRSDSSESARRGKKDYHMSTNSVASISDISMSPSQMSSSRQQVNENNSPMNDTVKRMSRNGNASYAIDDTIITTGNDALVKKTQSIRIMTQLSTKSRTSFFQDMSLRAFSVFIAMFLQKHYFRPSSRPAASHSFGANSIIICWGIFSMLNWYQENNPVPLPSVNEDDEHENSFEVVRRTYY